jgi:hypothetical protein
MSVAGDVDSSGGVVQGPPDLQFPTRIDGMNQPQQGWDVFRRSTHDPISGPDGRVDTLPRRWTEPNLSREILGRVDHAVSALLQEPDRALIIRIDARNKIIALGGQHNEASNLRPAEKDVLDLLVKDC